MTCGGGNVRIIYSTWRTYFIRFERENTSHALICIAVGHHSFLFLFSALPFCVGTFINCRIIWLSIALHRMTNVASERVRGPTAVHILKQVLTSLPPLCYVI